MSYFEFGYFGLFGVCFLAATILPLTSEGVLLVFLAAGYDPIICLIASTLGNTLGGTTNYAIGLLGNPDKVNGKLGKRFSLDKIKVWTEKYGVWLGLLSWTPILGDPLTIALGYFRVKFLPLLLLMTIGKFTRYYVIIYLWG
jgi:membrane protein YqaA with SNARE-associated domain